MKPHQAEHDAGGDRSLRVLIIRLSAIGDVVFASPLVDAIRRHHPDAEICWLAESMVAPLLIHHPGLKAVLIWQRREWREWLVRGRWLRLIREVRAFRQALRSQHFDVVLDAQGLLKSAFLAWMTGAPVRVGFRSKEPTSWFLTERIEKDLTPTISSEYRGLAAYMGYDPADFSMQVSLSPAERDYAERFHGDRPYAVLCPFTTRAQKHWPEAHWRDLAGRMVEQGWRVVVLGAPSDEATAERIFSGHNIELMVGRSALLESAALVSRASLVIGVDTGLTHMGWAFSVPTVALFGSTRPYLDIGDHTGSILYEGLSCSPCRRKPTCGGSFECMSALTPSGVLHVAQGYLSTESSAGRVVASSANREEAI
jgi:heptosyltransferase-1